MTRRNEPPLLTLRFVGVSVAHALVSVSFWMMPLFPLYLVEHGAGDLLVGFLVGVEPLAAIAVRPLVGTWMERIGRVGILRVAGVVHVAALLLYLVVPPLGVAMFLVRLLHGVGLGCLFATFFTYAADISPESRRTEGLAIFGVSGLAPAAVATILGEAVIARFGFPGYFLTTAAAATGSLVLTWPLSEPTLEAHGPARGFWHVAFEPTLRRTWVTGFVFATAMASYNTFLAPYGHGIGLGGVGLFFFAYAAAAVALRIGGGRIPDRVGPARTVLPSLGALAAGLFVLATLEGFPERSLLVIAGVLCGIGHGYLFPVLTSLALSGAGPASRGQAVSLFTALVDLGHVAGPMVLGGVAAVSGYPWVFVVAAVLVLGVATSWRHELSRRIAHVETA